ncbi:LamG domain-containing protein [Streptomyces sp. NBC_01498]|uniref:LamG domain-containing protein n=1 Tax=Streptomyces sp. NBC_01498 TaxID=2975870 RepID=UPI002E7ACD39|nr:LamG domain-containing protein [Streptomyces sp. NBC_01498]WTL23682.1 LamG domain-containing protein [Streptomyces sp. NBC_01498]
MGAAPGALASPAAPAAPAAVADVEDGAGAEESALAAAKRTGEPVEVVEKRSERSTVFANPDGMSFTLEESNVPVRVAKDGGWEPPDATLEKRGDGTVGAKAATADMTLSGGGAAEPLASVTDRGRALALRWPGHLPEPELNGASALYAEVLPGVDLQVNVTAESFRHVLVVKTPEAAENPKLRELTFGLTTKGLTVREATAGSLTATDSDGRTVFRAPPAQMWDSAGKADAARPKAAPAPPAFMSPPTTGPVASGPRDTSEASPSGTGLEPGQGDNVARLDVEVSDDALSVVPDAAMLAGAQASEFPIFIDPNVSWGESERTLLRSDGYESYGWSNGDDGLGKGAGKCGNWSGYYCGPGYVQRLYFEFSPASLKGKHVLDATFRVTEPWAFQCEPRWVDLVRTNNISSSTTWSSRPKELDWMGDRHVSAGRGSLCDPDSPDAPIEFNDNPEESNENLTPTVRDFAAGKFSRFTLEIRANDESDTAAWKRFKNDAVLAVKYVAKPALPVEVGLTSGSGVVCSTNSADPDVISDPTPLVTAKPKTAAGGESGASLRVRWRTERLDGTTWVTAHTDVDSPTSGYAGNAVKQSKSLPTLVEGKRYRLLALTLSYYESGSDRLNTGYTKACYFGIDTTAPKAPTIAVGGPYSLCQPNACVAGGGPGTAATFTFTPAAGDTNSTAYQYKLSSADSWKTAVKRPAGGGATALVNPARSGTHRVYARVQDSVGRWGAQNVVDFLVAAGEGPTARWRFDEATGVAVDSANTGTARHDATLGGTAARDDRGRRGVLTHDADGVPLETPVTDRGLSLDGSGGYAATGGQVLETRSAYTVSSWARLDSTDTRAAILSQGGAEGVPFGFWYSDTQKKWFFGILRSDKQSYTGRYSNELAQTGVWTHLAGTFDPVKKEMSFYVNGKRQGVPIAAETTWQSTFPLQIGRTQSSSLTYSNHFPGSLDEIAVWQRELSPAEIADEARLLTSESFAGVELVADWKAELGSGSTVPDVSGYGRALTLQGGAAVTEGAIVLDGVDDMAGSAAPLAYDHGSFTASTVVQLDRTALMTKDIGYTGQVLGQRTADGSAWGLWYQLSGKDVVLDMETGLETVVPVGKWHFGRLNNDGSFDSVVSDELAVLDSEVRLTGTYDVVANTISLYLGRNQNGDDTAYTAPIGSGEFAVGAGLTSGAWKHHVPARISEVRLWAGAMASSAQIDAHVGD